MNKGDTGACTPYRVVVADDTPGIRLLLRHILEGSGDFSVVGEAADGQEAVDLAARLQPDLVLLDLVMPRLDGLEAMPSIRAAAPATRILMLSGFAAGSMAVSSPSEGGPDGFVEKRQRPEEILALATEVAGLGPRVTEPPATAGPAPAAQPAPDAAAGAPASPAKGRPQQRGPSASSMDALDRARADLAQIGSAAAHDLRSPLQAAMGFAHLLDQLYTPSMDERGQMFVHTIIEATERMALLVDSLGAYCRAASIRPDSRHAVLGDVVADALESLVNEAADAGAEIQTQPMPQLVEDPDRVALVLTHLVSNALRWGHRPGDPPRITVTAEDAQWGWTVAVDDAGPGIEVDYRSRVFALFPRSPGSGQRGTGAGLATAKRLVESWGGGIWIDDAPGGGTRVCFTLPGADFRPGEGGQPPAIAAGDVIAEDLVPRTVLAPPAPAVAGNGASLALTRLLLVEDSEPHARLVAAILEEAPGPAYRLRHVTDLRSAQTVLGTEEVDCVLLDLSLPDGEGLGSLAAVRSMRPATPVVVLTSRSDEALGVAAVQQGAQDYLVKGALDPRALARSIRYAIERKALEAQLARQALHDALTGLPNRTLLLDRLVPALARADRTGEKLALLYLDLDGFKPINDVLGHEAGDWILTEVGRRLTSIVRPHDTVARIGGDEFAVLCEGFHTESEIQALAGRMAERIAEPVVLGAGMGSGEAQVRASIGIAFVAGPGESVEELMRQADRAMYANKRARRPAAAERDGA